MAIRRDASESAFSQLGLGFETTWAAVVKPLCASCKSHARA